MAGGTPQRSRDLLGDTNLEVFCAEGTAEGAVNEEGERKRLNGEDGGQSLGNVDTR